MAMPVNPKLLQPIGEAVRLADGVRYNPDRATGDFSVSENGILMYESGSYMPLSQLPWFDRDGNKLETVGEPERFFQRISISPDGKRALATIRSQDGRDKLWIYDLARGVGSRFSFSAERASSPVWSPDGHQVVYGNGNAEIILDQIEGSSQSRAVVSGGLYHERWPTSWSPDGTHLAYQSYSGKIGFEVWTLPLALNPVPSRFNPTRAYTNVDPLPFFSPNGKWLAYVSEESGQMQLYVAKFPGGRGKQQISSDGAVRGFWRHDGREILYITREKKLVGLPVVDRGDSLEIGKSYPLFANKIIANHDSVDISKDGQRLLMPIPIEEQVAPVTLVTNWTATMER